MNPTPSQSSDVKFEIGHVLFIDIVGYSKLRIDEQKEWLRQLTDTVLATAQVREATNEQLVRLPTGDGMALVFRNSSGRAGADARWRSPKHSKHIREAFGAHGNS